MEEVSFISEKDNVLNRSCEDFSLCTNITHICVPWIADPNGKLAMVQAGLGWWHSLFSLVVGLWPGFSASTSTTYTFEDYYKVLTNGIHPLLGTFQKSSRSFRIYGSLCRFLVLWEGGRYILGRAVDPAQVSQNHPQGQGWAGADIPLQSLRLQH